MMKYVRVKCEIARIVKEGVPYKKGETFTLSYEEAKKLGPSVSIMKEIINVEEPKVEKNTEEAKIEQAKAEEPVLQPVEVNLSKRGKK